MNAAFRFITNEDGPTAVEYAVLLALILMMCVGAITMVGGESGSFWSNNQSELEQALP